jgi:hypothetical protein
LSLSLSYALISPRVIPTYRSLYGETRVAQTSGPLSGVAGSWLACSRGNVEI